MPAKEIRELRLAGRLDEAYNMAKAEYEADPNNIWTKRNLSWVLYAQLDALADDVHAFIEKLSEVHSLGMPESEAMFLENISIVIAKCARTRGGGTPQEVDQLNLLFLAFKDLPIKRDSKWFQVLFKAMHKGLKNSFMYLEFADWWDFKNFKPEDFQKEKLPDGKEVMALAEQGFISYAKQLLPRQDFHGQVIFNREKAESFLPALGKIVDDYPQFQFPGYFKAKLLMALEDRENMLETLMPFARRKRNDFWVWDILAEALSNDAEKSFSCYCKALSCKAPNEMLVNLRQKMARLLIEQRYFNEAKTEIELLIQTRNEQGYKIPTEVMSWQNKEWYTQAQSNKTNIGFYKPYLPVAEALLYSDIEEQSVIVEFVNEDKKILSFISMDEKFGFFKYDRLLSEVKIGETLNIRFQDKLVEGRNHIYTAVKTDNPTIKERFIKEVNGVIKIQEGKPFGFIEDVYVHPKIISKNKLVNGATFNGHAIRSFNTEKKQWGWKML